MPLGKRVNTNLFRRWFNEQESFHFYASSLLFVYEGNAEKGVRVDIRMIDFSHVFSVQGEKDDNYLHGLNYIHKLFTTIYQGSINGDKG
jgi:hypothetical protein